MYLFATTPSQLGKFTLQINLTDFYLRSTSELIQLQVINDPPVFPFAPPKSQKIKMNQVSTYTMPMYFDLEMLPVTVEHNKLPPFCIFSEDVYRFDPLTHFGQFEVSGHLSDSLNQKTPFSFKVVVTNTKPFFAKMLSDISLNQGESANYTLPVPEDKENQEIYLETYEKGQTSLPKFMTYEPGSRTYQI